MTARPSNSRLAAGLVLLAVAFGAAACAGPKYYVYDEYLNKDMQAKVAASNAG